MRDEENCIYWVNKKSRFQDSIVLVLWTTHQHNEIYASSAQVIDGVVAWRWKFSPLTLLLFSCFALYCHSRYWYLSALPLSNWKEAKIKWQFLDTFIHFFRASLVKLDFAMRQVLKFLFHLLRKSYYYFK